MSGLRVLHALRGGGSETLRGGGSETHHFVVKSSARSKAQVVAA